MVGGLNVDISRNISLWDMPVCRGEHEECEQAIHVGRLPRVQTVDPLVDGLQDLGIDTLLETTRVT
jgi:hypothetical protein